MTAKTGNRHEGNGRALAAPSNFLDAMPPNDPAAELAVVGSILHEPSRLEDVSGVLRPDHFHDEGLGRLYEHVCSMEPAVLGDSALLSRFLLDRGDLEFCGGPGRIAECLRAVGAPSHIAYYADIVRKLAHRRRLINLAAEVGQQAYLDTADPADLLGELREAVESHAGPDRFKAITCAELDGANYSVDFLIHGALAAGQPAFIGAAPKCCKTLIALDAALSLATETPFLGVIPVRRQCRVGYMSGEGGPSMLQDYARRVAHGKGLSLAEVEGLVFADHLPQLDSSGDVAALGSFIRANRLGVVVLDCLYLCMPADDAGNLLRQGKILRQLNNVCLDLHCTPVLVHHTRKNGKSNEFEPVELADLAWSGFSEFAGQWWLVGRREKYDADDPGEHRLWLNIGGRAGHSALYAMNIHEGRADSEEGRYWQVDLLKPTEARQHADDARERARATKAAERMESDVRSLLDVLAKNPGGQTKNELRAAAGFSGERVNVALAWCLREGCIAPCSISKDNRNTPYEGYKLATRK